MADFDYVAIDTKGAERRGHVAAADIDLARATLDARKFYVVKISPGAPPQATKGRPLFGLQLGKPKMSGKNLTLFTRQLATLNRVSPLEESLRTITRQTEQDSVRAIVQHVHAGVVEGRRLADSMAREPKSFPPLYRAMVAAGESSGSLPTILDRYGIAVPGEADGQPITATAGGVTSTVSLTWLGIVVPALPCVLNCPAPVVDSNGSMAGGGWWTAGSPVGPGRRAGRPRTGSPTTAGRRPTARGRSRSRCRRRPPPAGRPAWPRSRPPSPAGSGSARSSSASRRRRRPPRSRSRPSG